MSERDPSIELARNRLGAAVRLGGDVKAARATLEFTKARRALREAVAAGISAAEHKELSAILRDAKPPAAVRVRKPRVRKTAGVVASDA